MGCKSCHESGRLHHHCHFISVDGKHLAGLCSCYHWRWVRTIPFYSLSGPFVRTFQFVSFFESSCCCLSDALSLLCYPPRYYVDEGYTWSIIEAGEARPSPQPTMSPQPTSPPSPNPTQRPTPIPTPSPTVSPLPTAIPTPAPSPSPTISPLPTTTPSILPSPVPTQAPHAKKASKSMLTQILDKFNSIAM